LWFSDDFLPSILLQVKPSCVNPFMDSSIDSDHSWESHSTGSSGRGTQHSDQGSLGSAQRAGLLPGSHDEVDGKCLAARLFGHWWRQSLFNVSLLQVAWTCCSLRFPITGSRSVTRTGSKFKSPSVASCTIKIENWTTTIFIRALKHLFWETFRLQQGSFRDWANTDWWSSRRLPSCRSRNFTTWPRRHNDRDGMDNNVGGISHGGRNATNCSGLVSLYGMRERPVDG
jgi:hypothetical protein